MESLIDELKKYIQSEAKESEEYIRLIQTCQSGLARIVFKVLLYDSILHYEIINDLILIFNSSNASSIYNECINYVKNNLAKFSENINKEELALNDLEKILKHVDNHIIESLLKHIHNDEENHLRLLKTLIKEVRT